MFTLLFRWHIDNLFGRHNNYMRVHMRMKYGWYL
jgi:hypothetical protein